MEGSEENEEEEGGQRRGKGRRGERGGKTRRLTSAPVESFRAMVTEVSGSGRKRERRVKEGLGSAKGTNDL